MLVLTTLNSLIQLLFSNFYNAENKWTPWISASVFYTQSSHNLSYLLVLGSTETSPAATINRTTSCPSLKSQLVHFVSNFLFCFVSIIPPLPVHFLHQNSLTVHYCFSLHAQRLTFFTNPTLNPGAQPTRLPSRTLNCSTFFFVLVFRRLISYIMR